MFVCMYVCVYVCMCIYTASKLAVAMRSVLEGIRDGGVASKTFIDAYDKQQTLLSFDPVMTITWPRYMVWSRHRAFITDNIDHERWVRLVSSSTLRTMVDANDLKTEQSTLMAERIASTIKGSLGDHETEATSDLGKTFDLDRQWELEDGMKSFAEALGVFIHRDGLVDLNDYVDFMTQAEEMLSSHVPQRGNKGSIMGETLVQFNRGKTLYKDGKLALQQARDTQAKVKPLKEYFAITYIMHTYIHTCIHTYIHTYKHTYIHTAYGTYEHEYPNPKHK